MVKSLFISFLLFACISAMGQGEVEKENRKKLSRVLKEIESSKDVTFSYSDDLIQEYKVSFAPSSESSEELIEKVLAQTQLSYQYIDDRHVVLAPLVTKGKSLCGYLIDQNTQDIIVGATISNTKGDNGVVSDSKGYFNYILNEEDKELSIQYLGYSDYMVTVSQPAIENCKTYSLTSSKNMLETVTVTEYLDDGISLSEDGNTIMMKADDLSNLPGNIDRDAIASLPFLPGINSPSESLDRLYVRGGTPDQNLILWDDIPMYHSSHLFGSISGFNPFMIDEVSVYRNGVSSSYGGRVSSVIDIKSKSEIPKRFSGGLGFNMTQVHLELATPLWKNSALFFSTRNSLTDTWNSPAFESYAKKIFQGSKVDVNALSDVENKVDFNDASAKWIYKPGKNTFEMSIQGSLNNLEYYTGIPQHSAFSVDELNLRHGGVKVGWERSWSDALSSEILFTTTEYSNEYNLDYSLVALPDTALIAVATTNKIEEGTFRSGLNWQLSENKKFKFGYQYTDNKINILISSRNFSEEKSNEEKFKSQLHALYAEYSMKVPKLLYLDMGIRYHISPVLNNSYFEPRVSVATDLTPHLKLKLSTSKNFQFVSQLVFFDTNELGLSNQIWITSNNTTVPVIEANQWTGGLLFSKDSWTIDVDAYVKEIAGLTSLSESFGTSINVPYAIGKARISGIDILLKKRWGKFKSWVSYSLSKTNYEFLSLSSEEFPASHDQTHVLQWVNLYEVGRWELSVGTTVKSGLPYSIATGVDNRNITYDLVNSGRLPYYFRLDASALYKLHKNKYTSSYLTISLQNITDHTNPIRRTFAIRDVNGSDNITSLDRVGLGFTPNVSLNFSF